MLEHSRGTGPVHVNLGYITLSMRPQIREFLTALLARPEAKLSLDVIGATLGAAEVTSEEIGELLDALEGAGKAIHSEATPARDHLALVITVAKALRQEQGTKPTVAQIATRSGLDEGAVRTALLFASVLGR